MVKGDVLRPEGDGRRYSQHLHRHHSATRDQIVADEGALRSVVEEPLDRTLDPASTVPSALPGGH